VGRHSAYFVEDSVLGGLSLTKPGLIVSIYLLHCMTSQVSGKLHSTTEFDVEQCALPYGGVIRKVIRPRHSRTAKEGGMWIQYMGEGPR
jgi:hypothetical protein